MCVWGGDKRGEGRLFGIRQACVRIPRSQVLPGPCSFPAPPAASLGGKETSERPRVGEEAVGRQ